MPRIVHLAPIPPTPSADLPSPGRLFKDRRALPRPEPGAPLAGEADLSFADTLRRHWPEFAVEAGFLALFVLAAGIVSAWLENPVGTGAALWPDLAVRRLFAGIAMGLVLTAMIYSPWGRRSGTHLNPAITLAYLRLGKIGRWDALFYTLAQFAGGLVAVLLLRRGALLPASTQPSLLSASIGPTNEWAAFLTELVLSASAMLLILFTSNHERWFRLTGMLYGLLIVAIVACAAPLSGFGMNLARLLAVDASGRPRQRPLAQPAAAAGGHAARGRGLPPAHRALAGAVRQARPQHARPVHLPLPASVPGAGDGAGGHPPARGRRPPLTCPSGRPQRAAAVAQWPAAIAHWLRPRALAW